MNNLRRKNAEIDVIQIVLVFLGAFLCITSFYVVLTKLFFGSWASRFDLSGLMVMVLFTISAVFVWSAVRFDAYAPSRRMMSSGFGLLIFILGLVIFTERALAANPSSGWGILYFAVIVLTIPAYALIAIGYKKLMISTAK